MPARATAAVWMDEKAGSHRIAESAVTEVPGKEGETVGAGRPPRIKLEKVFMDKEGKVTTLPGGEKASEATAQAKEASESPGRVAAPRRARR